MPTDADRVKNVFLSAAAKPPADRAVFLDETCGPDRELRAAVDRLLAAHDRPDSLLDRPVNGFADENATLTGCAADPRSTARRRSTAVRPRTPTYSRFCPRRGSRGRSAGWTTTRRSRWSVAAAWGSC